MTTLTAQPTSMQQTLLVMDVVDQIRHDESMLEAKTAEALSDDVLRSHVQKVYASNGITVTDELMAKAIDAYRAKQFAFTPAAEGWAKKVALLYVTRDQWLAKVGLGVGAVVLSVAAVTGFNAWRVAAHEAAIQKLHAEVSQQVSAQDVLAKSLASDIATLMEHINARKSEWASTNLWSTSYSVGAGVQLQERLANVSAALKRYTLVQEPKTIDELSVSSYQEEAGKAGTVLSGIQNDIKAIRSTMEQTVGLVTLESEYRQLIAGANVKGPLQAKKDALHTQVQASFSDGNYASAQTLVADVRSLVANSGMVNSLMAQLEAQRKNLQAYSWKDQSVVNTVEPIFVRAEALLAKGDVQEAKAVFEDGVRWVEFAKAGVTYTIVSRQGVKSGVERSYQGDRAKSKHYVIVEALDAAGQPYTVPVKDVETGTVKLLSLFGMGVSSEVFNRIRADKKDDGIIQKNVVGRKAAGTLNVDNEMAFNGDYIVTW